MKDKMSIIKNYEFEELPEGEGTNRHLVESFSFSHGLDNDILEKERALAEKNNFEIHPVVKEKRGIRNQERAVKEEAIESEIQKRLEKIQEEAFREGYEEGKNKGRNDVYEQTKIEAGEKLERLGELVDEVLKSKISLIREEKKQIYNLIQTLAKWVILRELKNDGDYLKRLLDGLAQEVEDNSEVLVYVDQESFNNMPEFIDYAKEKLSDFKNVKVEADQNMEGTGIVICSESEIISGTLSDQFKSLDKLFYSCGINEGKI